MIGSDLLRYKDTQKFVLVDFETTSLNLRFARIWQCSFIVFTLREIIKEFDAYLWWDNLRMSEGAAKVTGFNEAIYKESAQDPRLVLNTLNQYVLNPEYIVVFHNGFGFDSMVYKALCQELGLPFDLSFLQRSYDTLALSKMYRKGIKFDRSCPYECQMRAHGMIIKEKTNLAAMATEFQIPFDRTKLHNSLYDCNINVEVFKKLVWALEI